MAVNEVREQLRQQLEEDYGVEGAAILMDRPPGGWSDLVTNDYLGAKLDATRSELTAEMQTLRAEMQTLRAELTADMQTLRSDLTADMATLSGSVDQRLRAQTWITTTTLVAGLTLAFTAGRFV